MQKYFAILLGNDLDLARVELQALIDYVSDDQCRIPKNRFVTFDMDRNPLAFIGYRAALLREHGVVIQDSCSFRDLCSSISKDNLVSYISKDQSFRVRVKKMEENREVSRLQVEKRVGKIIQDETGASVSLEKPNVRFLVILEQNRYTLAVSKSPPVGQVRRLVKSPSKPFFHPSIMNSILARVMCNIAKIDETSLVLDPFCGVGGILIQASKLASSVVGVDRNWKMLQGAFENLSVESEQEYALIQGDARQSPIAVCDSIVTDPPYGRSSSTRGAEARELVGDFLSYVVEQDLVKQSLCICGSTKMGIPTLCDSLGLTIRYKVRSRIHSSLTREIICCEF